MLHFIQDAIVISVLNCNEVSSRFHPCFLQHNWKYMFQKRYKQKIYLQDTWQSVFVVPIFCLFWNRIGNDVLHSRKGWVQGCRQQHQHVKQLSFYYSCKKSTSLCYPTLFNYWTLILPEKCLPHTSTSSRTRLMTYDCKMTFWFVFLTSKLNYYFDLF